MRNLIGNHTRLERLRKIDLLYKVNDVSIYINLEETKTISQGCFIYDSEEFKAES